MTLNWEPDRWPTYSVFHGGEFPSVSYSFFIRLFGVFRDGDPRKLQCLIDRVDLEN